MMNTRSLEELIDREHHAWDEIIQLFADGTNTYAILPAEREAGEFTLSRLQVSTRSYLGAVAYEAGGIVIDHGWITLLGAGAPQVYGNLLSWNGVHDQPAVTEIPGLMTVAYDAAGGFFALDTGRFESSGHVYYFAPDALEWESTELAYSGFVSWLATGDLQQFYETFRWNGWQQETAQLAADCVFSYYPPLWTKEGGGDSSYKAPISIQEAWGIALEQYQEAQMAESRQTAQHKEQAAAVHEAFTAEDADSTYLEQDIDTIEQYYSICFPLDYLEFVRQAEGRSFQYINEEGQTDWEIRFSALDDAFIVNNQSLTDDVNPDPKRIIPFAWSVSSGNNYLLDYRYNPAQPSVLVMEHEEAMVRADAEAEAENLEEAQQLLEGNVRQIADSFAEFAARLQEETESEV